jgi:hypothetical protein
MQDFLARWVPENVEADLPRALAAVDHLLRMGDIAHLEALATFDLDAAAPAATTRVEWTAAGLEVVAEATWVDAAGEPLRFRRDGDRLIRVLPESLAGVIPVSLLDVTDSVEEAGGGLNLRSRGDRVSWRLPTITEVHLDDLGDGLVAVRTTATATIDPATAVFGGPLDDGTWEVGARFAFMGVEVHAGVADSGKQRSAVIGGRAVTVYVTGRGGLALDVGARSKPVITPARVDAARATVEKVGTEKFIRVPLVRITQFGSASIELVVDGVRSPSTLESSSVLVPVPREAGNHPWSIVLDGIESKPLPPIVVGRFGKIRLKA